MPLIKHLPSYPFEREGRVWPCRLGRDKQRNADGLDPRDSCGFTVDSPCGLLCMTGIAIILCPVQPLSATGTVFPALDHLQSLSHNRTSCLSS